MQSHKDGKQKDDLTDDTDEGDIIRSYKQKLTRSGSGSGVALHFDSEIAEKLQMESDTEIEVSVVNAEGELKVILDNIPAGFTRKEFEEFADRQGWERTSEFEVDDEWALTYRDSTGDVRIEVDSTTQIDGDIVNNISITGPEVPVEDDLEAYENLRKVIAQNEPLHVRVRDSEGVWQRLQASTDHDADCIPDKQAMQQLIEATDQVTVQLVAEFPSLTTVPPEIGKTVQTIQEAIGEY